MAAGAYTEALATLASLQTPVDSFFDNVMVMAEDEVDIMLVAKMALEEKGMTVDTTRGRFSFRRIDNQLSCSAYFGMVADDPMYPFPIYHDLMEFKGPDIWRPEVEIRAARTKE